jgi:hypothetical protein
MILPEKNVHDHVEGCASFIPLFFIEAPLRTEHTHTHTSLVMELLRLLAILVLAIALAFLCYRIARAILKTPEYRELRAQMPKEDDDAAEVWRPRTESIAPESAGRPGSARPDQVLCPCGARMHVTTTATPSRHAIACRLCGIHGFIETNDGWYSARTILTRPENFVPPPPTHEHSVLDAPFETPRAPGARASRVHVVPCTRAAQTEGGSKMY